MIKFYNGSSTVYVYKKSEKKLTFNHKVSTMVPAYKDRVDTHLDFHPLPMLERIKIFNTVKPDNWRPDKPDLC